MVNSPITMGHSLMNRLLSALGIVAVVAAGIGAFYLIGVIGLFAVVVGSIVCVQCYKRLDRYPSLGSVRRTLFAFAITVGIVVVLLGASYATAHYLRGDGEKAKETVVT